MITLTDSAGWMLVLALGAVCAAFVALVLTFVTQQPTPQRVDVHYPAPKNEDTVLTPAKES